MSKKNSPSLYQKALQYLARREHTRSQLRQKLLRHAEADEVNETLDRLERDKVLSEERYLESYIETQVRKLYGPERIIAGLCYRGYDRNVAERSLREASVDWLACARRCYTKRFSKAQTMDERERGRRIRFLRGRGYHEDTIHSLLAGSREE